MARKTEAELIAGIEESLPFTARRNDAVNAHGRFVEEETARRLRDEYERKRRREES